MFEAQVDCHYLQQMGCNMRHTHSCHSKSCQHTEAVGTASMHLYTLTEPSKHTA